MTGLASAAMAHEKQDPDPATILKLMRAFHAAMVDARTDLLADMVAPDYSLVHITGYRQPRDEWFQVIDSRQFDYHKIDIDQMSVSVSGESASVTGTGIFNATINGMHAPWRLRFAVKIERAGGRWKLISARYDSF
jgi:ketosteroid isomerase-like protein